MKVLPLVLLAATAAACTWVEPKPEAAHIKLVPFAEAQHCERVGQTSTKGVSKVGIFVRKDAKVEDELASLAKDQAYSMGGNRIVRESELTAAGEMTFGVYRCP